MNPHSELIIDQIRQKAQDKKKIVFVSGNFNIVHPGHLRMLSFASGCGDFLVLGVNGNSPEKEDVLLDEEIRLEGVKSVTWVDFCFILREPPEDFISSLKPAIVVKGKEHEEAYNVEADAVSAYGGKLLFSSGDVSFSLVDLLRNESKRLDGRGRSILKQEDFMKRHGFDWECIPPVMKRISELNVMVLGEIIVDEYIHCDALGMSREDPTVVVTPVDREKFLGGAAIVASHARSLGARVSFFSVAGEDDMAQFARQKLKEYDVNGFVFTDESRPTILKQRFRCSEKSLLRVNHLRAHPISKELQAAIKERLFAKFEKKIDLLIFSDFNYGILPQPLVDAIVRECRERGIMMVADSQSSSQIGDVSRFSHTMLLTPTEHEARLAVKDFESGLVVLAEKLRQQSHAENVFITLDKEGMLIHAGVPGTGEFFTDKLSAMSDSVKDPAGAGDSLLTCSALALASGVNIWKSAYIGSLAAACQIERTGNSPLSAKDLLRKITK